MAALNETKHAGGFILSEANGNRSRENVTIAASQTLQAGAVLGKVTSTGHYAVYNNDTNDGTETAAGILLNPVTTGSGETKAAAIIARDAEVLGEELVWGATQDGTDQAAGIADLQSLGIIVR